MGQVNEQDSLKRPPCEIVDKHFPYFYTSCRL